MKRNSRLGCWSVILLLGGSQLSTWGQDLPPLAEILKQYNEHVDQIRSWNGSLEFKYQVMSVGRLDETLKTNMEKIYGISSKDRVTGDLSNLYFKTHASGDWQVRLSSNTLQGNVSLLDSQTLITREPPILDVAKDSILRKWSTLANPKIPIRIQMGKKKSANQISPFLFPEILANWHYLPYAWFPPLDQIGFPEDEKAVQVRQQDTDSLVLIYTPVSMGDAFLNALRLLAQNPDLQWKDLTNILLLDIHDFTCRSFSITIDSEGKRRPLFNIAHANLEPIPNALSIPSLTTLLTSWRVKNGDRYSWSTNYFGQFSMTKITDRRNH